MADNCQWIMDSDVQWRCRFFGHTWWCSQFPIVQYINFFFVRSSTSDAGPPWRMDIVYWGTLDRLFAALIYVHPSNDRERLRDGQRMLLAPSLNSEAIV